MFEKDWKRDLMNLFNSMNWNISDIKRLNKDKEHCGHWKQMNTCRLHYSRKESDKVAAMGDLLDLGQLFKAFGNTSPILR